MSIVKEFPHYATATVRYHLFMPAGIVRLAFMVAFEGIALGFFGWLPGVTYSGTFAPAFVMALVLCPLSLVGILIAGRFARRLNNTNGGATALFAYLFADTVVRLHLAAYIAGGALVMSGVIGTLVAVGAWFVVCFIEGMFWPEPKYLENILNRA